MKKHRRAPILGMVLGVALLLAACLIPTGAAETDGGWLIPKARDYPAFTDTRGTAAEAAAGICCETGLMDGMDARHFMPSLPLSNAQVIVICARLHRLLTGGDLGFFEPISRTGADWWKPYDGYLSQQLPGWPFDPDAHGEADYPKASCSRGSFLALLAAVLDSADTPLPERNIVTAVPDCDDPEILRLYRIGLLGGKDDYGTLAAFYPLSRGAAAAMLARLVVPAQRLTLTLKSFDLCRDVFLWAREDVVLTVDGAAVTAEQFAPILADELVFHRGMMQDISYEEHLQYAVDAVKEDIALDRLAESCGLSWTRQDLEYGGVYGDGYRGRSENGQLWLQSHRYLRTKALPDVYLNTYGAETEGKSPYPAGLDRLTADLAAAAEALTADLSPTVDAAALSACYSRLLEYPTYRIQDTH